MRFLAHLLLFATVTSTTEAKPELENKGREINQSQLFSESAEVFTSLRNATIRSFAKKFFQIDTNHLISALTSVSILAANSISPTDDIDIELVNIVKNSLNYYLESEFDLRSLTWKFNLDRLTGNTTADWKAKEYYSKFAVNLKYVFFAISEHNLYGGETTIFQLRGVQGAMANAMTFFKNEAFAIQKNITDERHFNTGVFYEVQTTMARNFFQAYISLYYCAGVLLNGTNYTTEIDRLNNEFEKDFEEVSGIFKKAYSYLKDNFFPGTIKTDIVRRTVDCVVEKKANCLPTNGSTNCDIAENIVNRLSAKYPWRHYGVLVANGDSIQKNSYISYDRSSILEKNYNGKDVFVFMATKNFTKNRLKYGLGREATSNKTLWNYQIIDALNQIDRIQLAILPRNSSSCFITDNDDVGVKVLGAVPSIYFWGVTYEYHLVF